MYIYMYTYVYIYIYTHIYIYTYIYVICVHIKNKRGDATNINPAAIQGPRERTQGPSGEFVKSLEKLFACAESAYRLTYSNPFVGQGCFNPKQYSLKQ